ncbi:MAG: gamma-glutamyl-gamma-aminobutyrate hydrolase family protein [Alphaproteobacteria bacterium]|nr:gamma-glutamyl-gamma-aminobutyrate hydrolase family protein [Alphaproteobacteria bacterium]
MHPHVAVIDPGMRVAELDCFNRMARRAPLPLTYHAPALFGLDSLRRAEDDLRGIVIFGSGASVHDDLPWQHELKAWLLPRLRAGVPTLGLCYGHQLVATLLGGEVGFLHEDHHKELGRRVVPLKATAAWDACAPGLVVSHREAVVRVPDEVDVVGSTEACAVDAFAHRRLPIYGFQAHPEATEAFLHNNSVPWPCETERLAEGHVLVDGFLQRVVAGRRMRA